MIGNQALHCLAVLSGLRPAATQLSAGETDLLVKLAEKSHRVVEIGVFEGVTSRRMLERMPSGGRLTCVDPFFSGRLGLAYGLWITQSQLRRAARADVGVRIERKLSHELAPEFADDIDLVFIDADHAYAAVKRDWQEWSSKVRRGGFIALHDSQVVPGRCPETSGPVKLVRELGNEPEGFLLQETRDTITVYRRAG